MVGIPLMKLGFLAVRQVTRPLARRIVDKAKDGTSRKVCIALGRVSLGMSGAIMELAKQEEIKAAQKKKEKEEEKRKKEEELGKAVMPGTSAASSIPAEGTSTKDWTKGARAVSPRSRSLLQSLSYGPMPREKYDSTVFLDIGRQTGEAVKVLILYPYTSTWDLFRKRFLAPYPEQKLVDAGADLLLELMAFTILALILSYELNLQFKANARKEAILSARLQLLEKKVEQLQALNHIPIEPFDEDSLPHLEEVVRYQWFRIACRFLMDVMASALVALRETVVAIEAPVVVNNLPVEEIDEEEEAEEGQGSNGDPKSKDMVVPDGSLTTQGSGVWGKLKLFHS